MSGRATSPYDRKGTALVLPNGSLLSPSLRFSGVRSGMTHLGEGALGVAINQSLALGIAETDLYVRSNLLAPIVTPLALDRAQPTVVNGEETTLDIQEDGTLRTRLAAYRVSGSPGPSAWGWRLYGTNAGLLGTPLLELAPNGTALVPGALVVGGATALQGPTYIGGGGAAALTVTGPAHFEQDVTITGSVSFDTPTGMTPPVGIGGPGIPYASPNAGSLLALYPTTQLRGLIQGAAISHDITLGNAAPTAAPTAFASIGLAVGGAGYLGLANSLSIYTGGAAAGALVLGTAGVARLTIAAAGGITVPGQLDLTQAAAGTALNIPFGNAVVGAGSLTLNAIAGTNALLIPNGILSVGGGVFSVNPASPAVALNTATPLFLNRSANNVALSIPSGDVAMGTGYLGLSAVAGTNALLIPNGILNVGSGGFVVNPAIAMVTLNTAMTLTLNRTLGNTALDIPSGNVSIGAGVLNAKTINGTSLDVVSGAIKGGSLNVGAGGITGGAINGTTLTMTGALSGAGLTLTGDIRIYRAAGPTTGYSYWGSTGGTFFGWDGASFQASNQLNVAGRVTGAEVGGWGIYAVTGGVLSTGIIQSQVGGAATALYAPNGSGTVGYDWTVGRNLQVNGQINGGVTTGGVVYANAVRVGSGGINSGYYDGGSVGSGNFSAYVINAGAGGIGSAGRVTGNEASWGIYAQTGGVLAAGQINSQIGGAAVGLTAPNGSLSVGYDATVGRNLQVSGYFNGGTLAGGTVNINTLRIGSGGINAGYFDGGNVGQGTLLAAIMHAAHITSDNEVTVGSTLSAPNGNIGTLIVSVSARPSSDGASDLGTAGIRFHNGYFNSAVGIQQALNVGPTNALTLGVDSTAKPSTNTWNSPSDSRTKVAESIRPYTDGLDMLLKLRPIRYRYNGLGGTEGAMDDDSIGFVAEEAQAVAPDLVRPFRQKLRPEDKEETELLSVNTHALTFMFINAFRALNERLKKLEAAS